MTPLHRKRTSTAPRRHKRQQTLFVVAESVPAFDRHAGYQRLYRILELLSKRYAITFIAYGDDPHYRTDEYIRALEKLGIEVYVRTFRVRQFWRARGRAVVFETYRVAEWWLDGVRFLNPALPIIIDSVDLHYLRELRMSEYEPNTRSREQALETRARELDMYRKADAVITVTEYEKSVLAKELPGLEVMVVPTIHTADGREVHGESRIPGSLLFVGGFAHPPNVDAVVYFCHEVLPLIRKILPSVPVWIVGDSPPGEILAMKALPGVEVTGYVPDLGPYLRKAWISIAPLRYGAGIKGKIAEAMAAGLPVVTTTIGAEGMQLQNRVTALIADSPQEFANAISELCQHIALHAAIARNALEHVHRNYAPSMMEDRLVRLLESVASRPPKRMSFGERVRFCRSLIGSR
jgi:glycosyltransferase involved in cell wall biosynthesis